MFYYQLERNLSPRHRYSMPGFYLLFDKFFRTAYVGIKLE